MRLRVREVKKEGFAIAGLAAHIGDSAIGDFLVDDAAGGDIVDLHLLGSFAFARFKDVGKFHKGVRAGAEARIVRPKAVVGGIGDPIPLVKALVGRIAAGGLAEVPFAIHGSGVSGVGEHFRHRVLPLSQPVERCLERNSGIAGTNRIAAGEQRGAAGRALRFDIKVEQAHPFTGELSMRGVGAPRKIPPP